MLYELFEFMLVVFYKFLEPNRCFAFKMDSDVCDSSVVASWSRTIAL